MFRTVCLGWGWLMAGVLRAAWRRDLASSRSALGGSRDSDVACLAAP